MSDDILIRREGAWGRITLNRPAALNSLTMAMCQEIDAALAAWAVEPGIHAVMIEGAGDRAFCAGGDIRWLADTAATDPSAAANFFRAEYRMNVRIHRFSKPYVALLDGVTMGGGVGVSMSASHRVTTERTLWAMPECMIGLVPDVGASWLLSHLTKSLGLYLGLTGARLRAADLRACGLATHLVGSASLPDLVTALQGLDLSNDASNRIDDALKDFDRREAAPIEADFPEIEALFSNAASPLAVLQRAERGNSPFAAAVQAAIAPASPTSLMLTTRLLLDAPSGFAACIAREFLVAAHLMAAPDFREGVRAMIIDKDKSPRWTPATLDAIVPAQVEAFFANPPGGPLDLTGI